jgi:hypothetical protein
MIERCNQIRGSEKGMALVLVLVFTGALLVLSTALVSFAVNEKLITNYNSLDIRLYYIAEAAAETGIAALQNDFQYAGEINGSLGEGSYNVTFTAINNQQRDIIALAVLKGYSKKLRITMELIEADGEDAVLIRQWHKAVSQ